MHLGALNEAPEYWVFFKCFCPPTSTLTGHGAGVGGALIERYKNTFNLQYAVVNRRITLQIHERLRGRSTRVFSTWS